MIPFLARPWLACKAFFVILFTGRWPKEAVRDAAPRVREPEALRAPAPATPVAPTATALELLAVLQRDGRLLDFLMEDLTPYGDAQVGAAVRDVHAGCRQALQKYATLAPVLAGAEGDTITVDARTDAGAVRVIGNVKGQPPFRGVLKHRGWSVERLDLPAVPSASRAVIAPAEVEVP
jgi:hypothetical protein